VEPAGWLPIINAPAGHVTFQFPTDIFARYRQVSGTDCGFAVLSHIHQNRLERRIHRVSPVSKIDQRTLSIFHHNWLSHKSGIGRAYDAFRFVRDSSRSAVDCLSRAPCMIRNAPIVWKCDQVYEDHGITQ
jgi:hypothetical protein